MAERIPVSVHLVDLNQFEGTSFEEVVNELVASVNQTSERLAPVSLQKTDFGDFKVKLYYSFAKHPPKWRDFLDPILDPTSHLATCQNQSYSYACFIGFKNDVFAVMGGFGCLSVIRFMVPDFGLEIIVRLFERDSRVVKSIYDRGLTGNVLGQAKFYRGDQRFSDENQFGKIYKQVQADLNEEILTEVFGFAKDELRRTVSGCMAKESFQINKSIDFDSLLPLIRRLNEILRHEPKFSLNKVFHLSRRNPQYSKLREELEVWAIDFLFTQCKKGDDPDVDFCHRKFEDYLTADSILIEIDGGKPIEVPKHSGFKHIIRLLKADNSYLDEDIEHFKHSVLNRKVNSYDENGVLLTSGTVLEHINGEFQHNDKTYFLVDKEWYQIQQAFIDDLNTESAEILKYTWDEYLITESFDLKKRESTFNQKFIGKPGFFVFDTITPDNIESCDILKYDNNDLHLIHVKKGFDNSIRDLAAQINIAAKYIQEGLRTQYTYLKKVENQTKKCKRSRDSELQRLGNQTFPKDGIASLFKGRRTQNIVFCLAFVDRAETSRSLRTDIQKFHSNIAKFSLLELRRELMAMGFGFKIIQLNKA